jgi:hypothetical protein
MRQPANSKKIQELKEYHAILKEQFRRGELEGKISILLKKKAGFIGISLRSYYRKINWQ